MSCYFVRKIEVLPKEQKVYMTIYKKTKGNMDKKYKKVEAKELSAYITETSEYMEKIYAEIASACWSGLLKLHVGICPINDDILEAFKFVPRTLKKENTDGSIIGEFISRVIPHIKSKDEEGIRKETKALLEKRHCRDYILDCAVKKGRNYIEYAELSVRKSRKFVAKVLCAGGAVRKDFKYPKEYSGDKTIALKALEVNACYYRHLAKELKIDREIIEKTFFPHKGRVFEEHDLDLIPIMAFMDLDGGSVSINKEFVVHIMQHMGKDKIFASKNFQIFLKDPQIARFWEEITQDEAC